MIFHLEAFKMLDINTSFSNKKALGRGEGKNPHQPLLMKRSTFLFDPQRPMSKIIKPNIFDLPVGSFVIRIPS